MQIHKKSDSGARIPDLSKVLNKLPIVKKFISIRISSLHTIRDPWSEFLKDCFIKSEKEVALSVESKKIDLEGDLAKLKAPTVNMLTAYSSYLESCIKVG